jgi:2-polyprenyl-6-methoxyphenol hydroxylase-like FAD-dependent oxidoreductase
MAARASEQSILIVGAGPAGLTAALEFARRGYRPRIIDKAPGPVENSRALGVNSRSLEILEPSGATEALLAIGNPLRRVDVVDSHARRILALRIDRLRHRFPFMLVVPQSETERILIGILEKFGIEIEWNTELMDLMWFGERFEATIATEFASETLAPDCLIGADGVHSTVRELSRILFEGEAYPAVFAIADIRYDFPRDAGVATIEVFPGGAVATFPINELTFRHVGTSGDVIELVKNRRSASEVLWHASLNVGLRTVSTFQRGGVFLAGDAAHTHSPVGARGMNLGIEDAGWLAHLFAQGREAEYTSIRHPVARKVVRRARRQTDLLFQHAALSPILLRRLGRSCLRLPFVEQIVLRRLAGLDSPHPPWLK